MRLILIEGLPGSGKTTTAKNLCRRLRSDGIKARWYLEESTEHPVHPKSLVDRHRYSDFSKICLARWQDFVESAIEKEFLHIMEGSAFQMTVRFMMQSNHPNISGYFNRFAEIVSHLDAGFVYLRPNSAHNNSRYISDLRGKRWTDKVSKGETSTPFAIGYGLEGIEGMHEFWSRYAELCDSLFELWEHPKKLIRFDPGDYKRNYDEALTFVKNYYESSERPNKRMQSDHQKAASFAGG